MNVNSCPALVALVLTGAFCAGSNAAEPHQHGTAAMTMMIEQTVVAVELNIPAGNVLGFEREPRDDDETTRLEQVLGELANPLELFSLLPDPQCVVTESEVAFGEEDHGHEHGEDEDHINIAAHYLLECPEMNAGGLKIATTIFERHTDLDTIDIQALIDGTPLRLTMTPHSPVAVLR